jgi:hypothetical protein
MSGVEGLLIGIAATVIGCVLVFGIRKTWQVAETLSASLKAIPELVKAIRQLIAGFQRMTTIAETFSQELQYLRGVAAQQSPNFGVEQQVPMGIPGAPPTVPPFPSMPIDRFRAVPDAEVEDTDMEVLKQTDAELVEIERLENLRQQGIVTEDFTETEPGVTVQSE